MLLDLFRLLLGGQTKIDNAGGIPSEEAFGTASISGEKLFPLPTNKIGSRGSARPIVGSRTGSIGGGGGRSIR